MFIKVKDYFSKFRILFSPRKFLISLRAMAYFDRTFRGSPPKLYYESAFRKSARLHSNLDLTLDGIDFLVYYGENKSASHFDMWNPVFEKLGERQASIIRYSKPWWPVRDKQNVFAISKMDQIEPLLRKMPNLKAVFYPANNGNNIQIIRNSHLNHIFIGHGDSNKSSSAGKIFRLYDYVWVAGQAHIDRFDLVSGDYSSVKFCIVGQPWMQEWLSQQRVWTSKDRSAWGYFPTWAGYYASSNYSSIHLIDVISKSALMPFSDAEHAVGYIKPHPWTSKGSLRTAIESLSSESKPKLAFRHGLDRMLLSNSFSIESPSSPIREILALPLRFVVCDISAAVSECLYAGVPIFLFRPPPPAELLGDFESQYGFCYQFSTIEEFDLLLKDVIIDGNDVLKDARLSAFSHTVDLEATRRGQFFIQLEELCT